MRISIKFLFILVFLLLGSIRIISAQEKKFVKVEGFTGYDDGGWFCFKTIRFSHQTLVDGNGKFLDYIDLISTSEDIGYAVLKVNQYFGLRVACDNHNSNGHYSQTISVPHSESTKSIPQYKEKDGCASASMYGTAYFYDAYNINYVTDLTTNNNFYRGGTNICVNSETDEILNIQVPEVQLKYGRTSKYLLVEDEHGNFINKTYLNQSSTLSSVTFRNIAGNSDLYNKEIYLNIQENCKYLNVNNSISIY